MSSKSKSNYSPYELAEHNFNQFIMFYFLVIIGIYSMFVIFLPIMQRIFFEYFLHGKVYNNGEQISYYIDSGDLIRTNWFTEWGADIYLRTAQEARYWFNPIISLFIPSAMFGFSIAIIFTTILPQSIGLMRQKIEREIAILLNKITYLRFGYEDTTEHSELIREIKNSDLRNMHLLAEEWEMTDEDLKVLYKAIIWRDSSFLYRLFHINDGISMYMRFYFTIKYNNAVLGFVYVGAAVLIIIIGFRGLKFIPPTQPSLVLFALGLEFSLLITYAFTIMYARQDEEMGIKSGGVSNEPFFMSSDFGSAREIEKLLRVFINIQRKKLKN